MYRLTDSEANCIACLENRSMRTYPWTYPSTLESSCESGISPIARPPSALICPVISSDLMGLMTKGCVSNAAIILCYIIPCGNATLHLCSKSNMTHSSSTTPSLTEAMAYWPLSYAYQNRSHTAPRGYLKEQRKNDCERVWYNVGLDVHPRLTSAVVCGSGGRKAGRRYVLTTWCPPARWRRDGWFTHSLRHQAGCHIVGASMDPSGAI